MIQLISLTSLQGIAGKVDVGHGAGGAIGPGEAAGFGLDAAGQGGVWGCRDLGVQAADPGLGQGEQLAAVGYAILVQIPPDPQLGKRGILIIDLLSPSKTSGQAH